MKELDKKTRAAPAICLEERERAVGGNRFLYRLLLQQAPRNTYFLQVATGEGEVRSAFVGEDLLRAAALFSLLEQNAVSPCHLEDVLADFEKEDVLSLQFMPLL